MRKPKPISILNLNSKILNEILDHWNLTMCNKIEIFPEKVNYTLEKLYDFAYKETKPENDI